MADSDAVVVSAAAAGGEGSSAGRGEAYGAAALQEAPYLSAAAGWELRVPGARGRRAPARCAPGAWACTWVSVGPRPRRPGNSPPLGDSPAPGAPGEAARCRCSPAASQRTGLGAEVPRAFVLGEGPAAHLHGLCFPVGRDLEFDPV